MNHDGDRHAWIARGGPRTGARLYQLLHRTAWRTNDDSDAPDETGADRGTPDRPGGNREPDIDRRCARRRVGEDASPGCLRCAAPAAAELVRRDEQVARLGRRTLERANGRYSRDPAEPQDGRGGEDHPPADP